MADGIYTAHDRAIDAYRELQAASDQDLQQNAIFAMGVLLGGNLPYAQASVVMLYERAWPEKAGELRTMLGLAAS